MCQAYYHPPFPDKKKQGTEKLHDLPKVTPLVRINSKATN